MRAAVSLVQFRVTAGDPADNLRRGEEFIAEAARRGSELVCFPEMWTTGFPWQTNARLAPSQDATIEAIGELARRYRLWIFGSVLAPVASDRMTNLALLFDADGRIVGQYRKTHLFRPIEEDTHVVAGDQLTLVETPWGRAGFTICYDIRFPELFRTYALRGADFVFLPAAVPLVRRHHWQTLARARAIENQMFVFAVNQVGSEDLASAGPTTYAGSSAIIDPAGVPLAEGNAQDEALLTATVDFSLTAATRARMNVLGDRRPELYDLGS